MNVTYRGKCRDGMSVDNGHGGEVHVEWGGSVDLPDEIAVRLIEQGWEAADGGDEADEVGEDIEE